MYNIEYFNFDSELFYNQKAARIAQHICTNAEKKQPLYKIFHKLNAEQEIAPYLPIAKKIRENFTDLIIISMGGATLNPSAVMTLIDHEKTGPNIFFLNSTDPYYFQGIMNKVNLNKTALLTISNSGNTLETIAMCGAVIEEFKRSGITNLDKRLFFITNKDQGILKSIAEELGCTIIEHSASISGRYSGLSNVVTIPGLISGLDMYEYINGANIVLEDFYNQQEHSKPALSATALYNSQQLIMVNIAYLQRFNSYLQWYSQIIAESLGKENKGYTPLHGLGPDDQHSMLQLYLDGPKDKIFTLLYAKELSSACHKIKTADISSMGYIAHKNLADINFANFSATLSALVKSKLPARSLVVNNLSAASVGGLMCHSMIEIVMLGHLMEVNPFDQPGVELIKILSKKIVQG